MRFLKLGPLGLLVALLDYLVYTPDPHINGLAFQPPQGQYRTFDWPPPLRKNLRDSHYSVIPARAITKIRLSTGSFVVDRAGLARCDSKSHNGSARAGEICGGSESTPM